MCLAVYIAGDGHLPLIDWDEEQRGFNVVPLTERECAVTKRFSFSHSAYLGTHLRCGCGFLKEGQDEEGVAAAQPNYDALADYLGELLEKGMHLELFCCWEGDQETEPAARVTVNPGNIRAPGFEFKEKTLYSVR